MSMPEYLEVAVVACSEQTLKSLSEGVPIKKEGIAPKYVFATLSKPKSKSVEQLSSLNSNRIKYWIALDVESFEACSSILSKNQKNAHSDGSFYDSYFKEKVVHACTNKQFIEQTKIVYEAFCESS